MDHIPEELAAGVSEGYYGIELRDAEAFLSMSFNRVTNCVIKKVIFIILVFFFNVVSSMPGKVIAYPGN